MSHFVFWDVPETPALAAARAEMSALRFQRAALRLALALKQNFNPSQPRVPAGNPDGGQWTRIDGSVSALVRVAANDRGPFITGGTYSLPVRRNPLDPAGLNPSSLSLEEQQQIADAVNALKAGDMKLLRSMQGHKYKNIPDPKTGAALSANGVYRTYYIGPKTGKKRLLVDTVSGQMYYTNNHYLSFWLIVPLPR